MKKEVPEFMKGDNFSKFIKLIKGVDHIKRTPLSQIEWYKISKRLDAGLTNKDCNRMSK